ncbi:MAG: 4-diphosphocytidyl-2C-methyl-D-erythritol kinase [Atopobiaceae bacterium]|jgi:4-diphosphocytidyl-2-C-methyl-D-erythritol kinase
MADSIRLVAPSKLNLYLGVHEELDERRYHRVDSIMTCVGIADIVTIEPAASLAVSCKPPADFPDHENTCWRAAELMGETFRHRPNVSIVVEKYVPAKSGMGGASADAAATLIGLCELWGIDRADPRVEEVARQVGADVPFFLFGPPALLVGAGDVMSEEFPSLEGVPVVVTRGSGPGISAREAYEEFDREPVAPSLDGGRELCRALREHDISGIVAGLSNNLEPVAERIDPQIARIRSWIASRPGVEAAMMTGSGSCVYGICESPSAALDVERAAIQEHGLWAKASVLVGEGPHVVG